MQRPPHRRRDVLACACALFACAADGVERDVPDAEVVSILDRNCSFSACHGNGGAAGGMALGPVLSGELSLSEALEGSESCGADAPLVVAGRPEASWLWQKLDPSGWEDGRVVLGEQPRAVAGCPEPSLSSDGMPPSSPGLDADALATVRAWIVALEGRAP